MATLRCGICEEIIQPDKYAPNHATMGVLGDHKTLYHLDPHDCVEALRRRIEDLTERVIRLEKRKTPCVACGGTYRDIDRHNAKWHRR